MKMAGMDFDIINENNWPGKIFSCKIIFEIAIRIHTEVTLAIP